MLGVPEERRMLPVEGRDARKKNRQFVDKPAGLGIIFQKGREAPRAFPAGGGRPGHVRFGQEMARKSRRKPMSCFLN